MSDGLDATSLEDRVKDLIAQIPPPTPSERGSGKKNYTEKFSHGLSDIIASELRALGLDRVKFPLRGRDKQFMGGYGTKGVDVYLADDKHGLLLSSGTKGIVFDVRKNIKNRYRDMVMEALELHRRFPFAVCGHVLFLGKTEAAKPSRKFGTVLGEAVALLETITERERPDEAPELYERMGIVLFNPGDPASLEIASTEMPQRLQFGEYCERIVKVFHRRNPFY